MSDPAAAFRLSDEPEIEVTVRLPRPNDAQRAIMREIVEGAPYRAHSSIWLHVEGQDRRTAAWLSYLGLVELADEGHEIRITSFGKAVLESLGRAGDAA